MATRFLVERARLYQRIRSYFADQGVLEVDVPQLGRTAALDPNLEALGVPQQEGRYFLQTSPEYFHKRLLAQGAGSIYSLTHAFRHGEIGRLHNPEFSLLEWYRVGFSMQDLIEDILALLGYLGSGKPVTKNSYAELFEEFLGVDPHRVEQQELNSLVAERTTYRGNLQRSEALELLFSQVIEPRLPGGAQVVTHYPAEQAALAKLVQDGEGNRVALRFEVYLNGVELANGYEELRDPEEQLDRFRQEQELRRAAGREVHQIDDSLIAALRRGLPHCSGVALGVDRLLMQMVGADSLAEVMPFVWSEL